MELYDGGLARIEGAGDWSVAGRTFLLAALTAGNSFFDPAHAVIADVVADARNVQLGSNYNLRYNGYDISPNLRWIEFGLNDPVRRAELSAAGAAVLFERHDIDEVSTDTLIAFLTKGDLPTLANGAMLRIHEEIPRLTLINTLIAEAIADIEPPV